MAQFNYAKLAQRVDKIMRQYGRRRSPTQTTFLRREGMDDRPVVAVEADFSPRERTSSMIQVNDTRYLVSAINLEVPPDSDKDSLVLIDNGVETEYVLVGPPKRTAPGGVNVFWQLHCREE